MNYNEAIEKLFSLHQFGIKLGLDNIRKLLAHIGNPEKRLKTIHIAGSNGKGSTASFIASILTEAGFSIGLYTSPHFVKFNERIRINGVEIPDTFVIEFMNKNLDYIEEESPTFFELTTALAFLYFAESNVDYAVIETGLGGRLDATNVLNSTASVFTSISYEHTNILGNNLATIAGEKAAIIKNNQKVFIGNLPEVARNVIVSEGRKKECDIYELSNYSDVTEKKAEIVFGERKFDITDLPLQGGYQIHNASLAVLTVSTLFPKIDAEIITAGLQNVISNTGIQGRYEIYNQSPKVIFDSAHNFEGVEVFLSSFAEEKKDFNKAVLIYGAMADKNVAEIIKMFPEFFDEIFVTEIDYERSLKIADLMNIGLKEGVKIHPMHFPAEYISSFIADMRNSKNALVVMGSIYVLGEIKAQLLLDIKK